MKLTAVPCRYSLEVRNVATQKVDDTGTEHKAGKDREQACNPCNKKTWLKWLAIFQNAVSPT